MLGHFQISLEKLARLVVSEIPGVGTDQPKSVIEKFLWPQLEDVTD